MAKRTKRESEQLLAVSVWQAAKSELDDAKAKELRLRLALIADVFGEQRAKVAGTSHAALADGSSIKIEVRRSAKVDAEQLPGAFAKLRELIGATKAKLVRERLIAWKPSASIRELVAMPADQMTIFLGEAITLELSSPSLEVTPAK
jgi:hypothetical protein